MFKFLLQTLTFGTVLSSILVITSKNPVIAVVYLIAVFINTAGYMILTGIGFLGLSYIIIYIGAITVLFLFIIMMINIRLVDILEIGSEYTKNLPLAIILGLLFIFEVYSILPFTFNNIYILFIPLNMLYNINNMFISDNILLPHANIGEWFKEGYNLDVFNISHLYEAILNFGYNNLDSFIINFLQIEVLGLNLYTSGSVWLFICSFILLLAMISAIFLSNTDKR